MLRVEIESSVTVHLAGDHFIKERRLLDMDAHDLADMGDQNVVTADGLNAEAVYDALTQVHADLAESIWDALVEQIDTLTSGGASG